MQKYLALTKTI